MTFRVGEVGKAFRYSTNGLVMSASTALTLNFTDPNGGTLQKTQASSNPVTAPAAALANDKYIGTQAASTYMEFTSIATDFSIAGKWKVCGIFEDATRILHGNTVEFTVLPACS
jgi:hypothetical protein